MSTVRIASCATPDDAARGISPAVVVAGVAAGIGAMPALYGITAQRFPDWSIASAGWTAFGIAAAILLDQDPRSRPGWTFVALGLLPICTLALPRLRASSFGGLEEVWDRGLAGVVLAVVAVTWAAGFAGDRTSRRRMVWLVVWSTALFAVVCTTTLLAGVRSGSVVLAVSLWGFAAVATRLLLAHPFRPVDEPAVDGAVVVAGALLGAVAGLTVRLALDLAGLPQADLSGAFVAVMTAALGWSAGLWLRRAHLGRKYGSGILSPDDVAAITDDLHQRTDPRELLSKAAAVVAAATGHHDVQIVLGPDAVAANPPWLEHPLVVAGDRVGTLLIDPRHPEGAEPRQERIVDQMLPTVGLVARAVALAVEADHARQDVARERDAERARILGDLHDGVGPVLAGMSMRVQAELRHAPSPLLKALASELADCRGDLRRIVSGLTPSALHDRDLADALGQLVASFGAGATSVQLRTSLELPLHREVAVAVYRSVAEGLTNALRHGRAGRVEVVVTTRPVGVVQVLVRDDGTGGTGAPPVPGVGLTSLARRAGLLGGSLQVGCVDPTGVELRVELPVDGAVT